MNSISSNIFYVKSDKTKASHILKKQLLEMLYHYNPIGRDIIVLCIGSDRSTGDSLGPLVGHTVSRYRFPDVHVYGTLYEPVHAANLSDTLVNIYQKYDNPFIIAVDASLGTMEHIGYITIGHGPLRPGLGVKKKLPSVGNIHITGIVNFSGMMENLLLQTTRLYQVMNLSDLISKAIILGLRDYFSEN